MTDMWGDLVWAALRNLGERLSLVLPGILAMLTLTAIGLALATFVFESGALRRIFGNFGMPLIVMAMGGGTALVLALVSGLPPAWRARQLNIVDALAGR